MRRLDKDKTGRTSIGDLGAAFDRVSAPDDTRVAAGLVMNTEAMWSRAVNGQGQRRRRWFTPLLWGLSGLPSPSVRCWPFGGGAEP